MKKFLSIILSFVLVLGGVIGASAALIDDTDVGDTLITDGTWTYERLNYYGYTIRAYSGDSSTVDIPYSFAKEYVTQIADHAFNANQTVCVVNTTTYIQTIGEYSFNNCTSLTEIKLHDSLSSIGVGCFYGDTSLNSVNIGDTSIDRVPAYCFAECGISEMSLPETCESIGNYAFYNCHGLGRINIPDSVTEIAANAFTGCENVVIYATKESYAIEYAIANGVDYVITNPDPVEIDVLLGDTDDDEDISIVDVTMIQRLLAGLDTDDDGLKSLRGDADLDGELTIFDATRIQRWLVDIPVSTPVGQVVKVSYTPVVA